MITLASSVSEAPNLLTMLSQHLQSSYVHDTGHRTNRHFTMTTLKWCNSGSVLSDECRGAVQVGQQAAFSFFEKLITTLTNFRRSLESVFTKLFYDFLMIFSQTKESLTNFLLLFTYLFLQTSHDLLTKFLRISIFSQTSYYLLTKLLMIFLWSSHKLLMIFSKTSYDFL